MKIGKPSDEKVILTIKKSARDAKTGKIVYETHKSIDIHETTADEVESVINNALRAATSKK